jgi:hypothetical protein
MVTTRHRLEVPGALGQNGVLGRSRLLRRYGAPLAEMMRRRGEPVAEATVAAAAVAVAGVPWHRAYQVGGFWPAVMVAAILPVAVAFVLGGGLRLRAAFSFGASLVGLFGVLVAVLGPHPSALGRGATRGPSRLLTDTLPLTGPRWVLVVPLVLTWLSAAAAGELLVRRRNPGPGLAIVVGSFVVAVAGVSAAPGGSLGSGVALVGLLAAVALIRQSPWRARGARGRGGPGSVGGVGAVAPASGPPGSSGSQGSSGDGRSPVGRAAAGALAAGVVAVGLWTIVPSLPGLGSSTDAVTRRPTVTAALATSPLDVIARLRDADPTQPATPLVDVTTSAPSTGYLALATFDTYDGGGWSFDRTYVPTGGRIPDPPVGEPAAIGPTLRQHYRIVGALPAGLPFVPFVDHPVTVGGLAVDADAASGTVVPVTDAVVGDTYSVVSRAPTVTLAGLPSTAEIAPAGGSAGIQLPGAVASDLGPTLTYLSSLTHQTPAPTVAFLKAFVAGLQRVDKRLIPTRTQSGGTSLAEVVSAITVDHGATPEQFATLFATVARSLGVPARVVTGFRISPGAGGLVAAGTSTVTNRQAWTWAEIPVVGMGWVVVDPTPTATTQVSTPPASAQAASPTTTAPAQNALPASGGASHALAPKVVIPPSPAHGLSPWWVVLLVIGGVALAVGALFGLVALARLARRSGRRRGSPPRQALGAWMDVLDTLARAGTDPGPATTTREVAELTGRSFGPDLVDPVRRVGAAADRAAFSSAAEPDLAMVQEAWKNAGEFGRNLRGRLSRPQRLQGALRVGTARRARPDRLARLAQPDRLARPDRPAWPARRR